ncbi:MAG TPA: IclR family transcriptional regulator [Actinomycetes bacterium]|nr:IclR family transcriptional regulator [Actinomycetes bacterium]
MQSVDRAVSIMEMLARRGPTRVTEVAGELGIHKSTAFRLLSTLEARGLVEQGAGRGRYRLGYGIVRLAGGATVRLEFHQYSRPICLRLAGETGETVNMAIRDGRYAINVEQVMGSSAVTTVNWVGQRTPLHATSSGKVFLAHLPEPELARLLAGPLERFTPGTVVDPARLDEQLQKVRADGYAYTVEELEVGLNAVAAPIRAFDGTVAAAVSVSGPSYRILPDRVTELGELVQAAARAISLGLPNGWKRPAG